MHLVKPEYLMLLWCLPLLAGLYAYAGWRRRQALERIADPALITRLTAGMSLSRRRKRSAVVVIAFCILVITAARPAWNLTTKTVKRKGRDVVFILDVSRSMLAEDLRPNRLERAKLAIKDCAERLEGDRVGLVAFAGNAAVKCPLTLDYGFFRMMLEDISTKSVTRGGTMIGDAIRKTLDEVFDDLERSYKDVILITDGEDHESFPVEAAADAGKRGIRLLAIGIGDEDQGRPIAIRDDAGALSYITYQGKRVMSKLDASTLRKMVDATPGGRYLNVATGTIDLGAVYQQLIASAEKKELEARKIDTYEEKFQIFAAVALLLLLVEVLINECKRPAGKENNNDA